MRLCYTLIATTAALLAHREVSSLPSEPSQNKLATFDGVKAIDATSTNKRLLRQFSELGTEDDEERGGMGTGTIVSTLPRRSTTFFSSKRSTRPSTQSWPMNC
ncbi:hypothetical protein JG687_00011357 [Phytophthora cactorum]|uniref:RxLR effector protein n=1 Tax=Phytophthora cactorum TaxID=29920 RepID=A0A329SKX3_9STRA|nr:hypothetical protein Pcac1_g15116 [Phytophthora cactorum]KAG2864242.1 hypothetical protein PC113_g4753 [Phytophthora cactorum]KAG2986518.1 hypothetical protein PC118_g7768 [Phytophthora cactorum]KAG3023631.1 hypothetical protein PC119_g8837 [Phytophthora cactorum]KAG3090795.1 hypothetical protein PC121_g4018 [Phytophthora cactorum]